MGCMNDEQLKANAERRQRRLTFLAERVPELHREGYKGSLARRQADVEWPAWDRAQTA